MKNKIVRFVCMIGSWTCVFGAAMKYDLKAGAVVALAMLLTTICFLTMLSDELNDFDFGEEHTSCDGCKHHLGGGHCDQNLEAECGKDEYKAWEE